MNKTIYTAPDVEQMEIRFEENIMSNDRLSAPAADDAEMINGEW